MGARKAKKRDVVVRSKASGRPLAKRVHLLIAKTFSIMNDGGQVHCDKKDFVRFIRPLFIMALRRQRSKREYRRYYAELIRLELIHDYHYGFLHDYSQKTSTESGDN